MSLIKRSAFFLKLSPNAIFMDDLFRKTGLYKMTNKISGIISFEINNDMLLKNNRTQNYHGINGFSYIPINYNLFALNIGVKI